MSDTSADTKYALRAGFAGDLEALLALQKTIASAPQWSAAIWSDLLCARTERAVFVIETPVELVGFIVVGALAGVAELESIVMQEAYRGRGLGRALCERAAAWALAAGAHAMQLEVRASNLAAVALYGALGFVEQGRRRGYYAAPAEDAVMMSLSLR